MSSIALDTRIEMATTIQEADAAIFEVTGLTKTMDKIILLEVMFNFQKIGAVSSSTTADEEARLSCYNRMLYYIRNSML